MAHMFDDEDNAGDIAIVGLGPGGLAAALSAASKGKTVVAFTDRTEYIRGQRMILSAKTTTFLKQHLDPNDPQDQTFWDRAIKEKTVQTKDVERFLHRKLLKYPKATIVHLTKPTKIQSMGNGANKTASFIELSNGKKYFCHHILAADGARHHFADIVNKQLQSDIQYVTTPNQERHLYHASVQLRLKYQECTLIKLSQDPTAMATDHTAIAYNTLKSFLNHQNGCIQYQDKVYYFNHSQEKLTEIAMTQCGDLKTILDQLTEDQPRPATYKEHKIIATALNPPPIPTSQPPENQSDISRRILSYIRQDWSEDYEPKYYIFSNADKTKFSFAGEIPKPIFDAPEEKRPDLLKRWASLAIKNKYGIPESQLEYRVSTKKPAKNHLQAMVFELKLQVCQKPVVDLCGGGVFSQIGDSRRTPNYNLGHGLNDAIAGSLAFVSSIEGAFNKKPYLESINAMDTYVENTMARSKRMNKTEKKLLHSIDKLIAHLQPNPAINPETLMTLKWGRNAIQYSHQITKMYEAINTVRPIIEKHQHRNTGIFHEFFRWFISIFNANAAKTKSARLFDDVDTKLKMAKGG